MNRIKKLTLLSLCMMLVASAGASIPSSDNGGKKEPSKDVEKPVIIYIPNFPGKKKMPSRGVEISIKVTDEGMEFFIPLEDYPLSVEVEQQTMPYGYWADTFYDSSSSVMDFSGTVGDYKLTVTTGNNVEYIGFFTLD